MESSKGPRFGLSGDSGGVNVAFIDRTPTTISTDSSDSGCSTSTVGSEAPLIRSSVQRSPGVVDQDTDSGLEVDVEGSSANHDRKPEVSKLQGDSDNKDSRLWLRIVILFGILDVLLFALILVIQFGLPGSAANGAASLNTDYGYCLPCEDVYLTTDDHKDNIYGFNLFHDDCCAENPTILVEKFVAKKYRQDKAKASLAKPNGIQRAAVHLPLKSSLPQRQAGSSRTLQWDGNTLVGTTNDVTLSADGHVVTVQRAGLYFVWVQMSFQDGRSNKSHSTREDEDALLRVERQRGIQTDTLLENRRTVSPHKETGHIPITVGAVFDFKMDDKLSVWLSEAASLYFEVYMI